MGALEFFASVVESLAWPLAVFFVAALFSPQIKRLLSDQLEEFSGWGVTAKFRRALNKLDTEVVDLDHESTVPPEVADPTPDAPDPFKDNPDSTAGESHPDTDDADDEPVRVADPEPLERFLNDYKSVEIETSRAMKRQGLPQKSGQSLVAKAIVLFDHSSGRNEAYLSICREFAALRNQVVHGRVRVSESDADQYSEIAALLRTRMRSL